MYVIPYLNFDGQCKAAFTFYQKILGGEIVAMLTHDETPAGEHVPPEWHDRIMHARLTADKVDLMASDAPPDRYEPPRGVYVSLHIDEPEEGGAHLPRARGGRAGDHADGEDVLGRALRHAGRSVRHSMDGELRPE